MSDWETLGEKPYNTAPEPEPAKELSFLEQLEEDMRKNKNLGLFTMNGGIGIGKSFTMGSGMLVIADDFVDSLSNMAGKMATSLRILKAREVWVPVDQEPEETWVSKRGLKPTPKKPNNPRGNKLHGTTWRIK